MVWQAHGSVPLRAPVRGDGLNGGSPFRANVLRPEADRNCVAERRGGEQRETNCRSAAKANLIRPQGTTSWRRNSEVQKCRWDTGPER
jgi:hypothetical protein